MTARAKGEILAPVGNIEMLEAAVRSGADAVYLGAKDFSARRNAENFSLQELKEAVSYCHIRGVKVYLTLNILIKNFELADAFALARNAYNTGIDGIIIQDLGLARLLHEKTPALPLHASTQMSVHSPAALDILKDLGFVQVVAAREMSKKELEALCERAKQLGITVEVFVHGALCMSMSGQCLLSAFLGSRSGNRGLCAGPCRLPFKVKNGTGYDLSLKDLSLLEYIPDLYEMGVGSFKIEGRMKRPEYVAAAVLSCRQALDAENIDPFLAETLKNVFSRSGFTAGYFENKLGRDMFGIRTKDDVLSADKAFPYLHSLYRGERSSIGLEITACIKQGEPVSLTVFDGVNTVTATGDIPEAALNREVTQEEIIKNLDKFGSTPYFAKNITVSLDSGLFVKAKDINELRRNACSLLDTERSTVKVKPCDEVYSPEPLKPVKPKSTKLFVRFADSSQIPADLTGIDGVIFPLEEEPPNIKNSTVKLVADIPGGITDETLILKRLLLFKEKGFTAALCGNLSAVTLAKQTELEIMADAGLNIANSESLKTVEASGITAAIISPEEKLSDIKKITGNAQKGIIAYGHIPLMLFKNCPIKNGSDCGKCKKSGVITDRTNTDFPIRCRMGYSELLNSLPLWLLDHKPELEEFDFALLYFSVETPERVKQVISAYKNGLSPDTKYTRGLYYRGTI